MPFHAEEVEYIGTGWLRAVGCWETTRWELGDDDTAYPIRERGETVELTWPARRVKEVRRG